MSNRVRYVFDTNTLVSAVLSEHSILGQALRRVLRQGEILVSPATLEELAEVLQREKFDPYVTATEREEFLEAFVERATFIGTRKGSLNLLLLQGLSAGRFHIH